MVFDRMGIDIWEVLDAASTKPFGFMRFNPGPGWGGHCIPLDPFYLVWKAREYGIDGEVHRARRAKSTSQMPHYVVEKLQLALNDRRQGPQGEPSARPGARLQEGHRRRAGEPGLRDHRSSCCLGARRSPTTTRTSRRRPGRARGRTFLRWSPQPIAKELLRSQDAVVIVTDHTAVDYALVAQEAPLVIDARGVYRRPSPERGQGVRSQEPDELQWPAQALIS